MKHFIQSLCVIKHTESDYQKVWPSTVLQLQIHWFLYWSCDVKSAFPESFGELSGRGVGHESLLKCRRWCISLSLFAVIINIVLHCGALVSFLVLSAWNPLNRSPLLLSSLRNRLVFLVSEAQVDCSLFFCPPFDNYAGRQSEAVSQQLASRAVPQSCVANTIQINDSLFSWCHLTSDIMTQTLFPL